jgi:hypothetical protein
MQKELSLASNSVFEGLLKIKSISSKKVGFKIHEGKIEKYGVAITL